MATFQLGNLPWRLADWNVAQSCKIASERHINTKQPDGSVLLYDIFER